MWSIGFWDFEDFIRLAEGTIKDESSLKGAEWGSEWLEVRSESICSSGISYC